MKKAPLKYRCKICGRNHYTTSEIGKRHQGGIQKKGLQSKYNESSYKERKSKAMATFFYYFDAFLDTIGYNIDKKYLK